MMLRFLLLLSFGACLAWANQPLSKYSYLFRYIPNKTVNGGRLEKFPGNVLIMYNQTPDQCAELCVANGHCKTFQMDQSGECRMRNRSPDIPGAWTRLDDNTRYDSYVMQPKDRIRYIKIEVSNQQNSESKDSKCVIKFPGGAVSAEFGSVFNKGQIMMFRVSGLDSYSKADYILKAGVELKCESASKDALHVNKVLIETEKAYYSGEVNNVFDDVDSCNTWGLHDLVRCAGMPHNKCCHQEVVVLMVSVPKSVWYGFI